jgi:hypothetical protein
MRRNFTAIGLSLVAALVLTAGGPQSTILVDDFNDGDDAGWEHEDLTPAQMATFDASSGSYTLDSVVPIPITDSNAGTIDAHWGPSINDPRFSNGTLRGTFRANTEESTVGFLLRTNDEAVTDYGFYGSTSFGTFYIESFDTTTHPNAPPQTIIAMADPAEFPFVAHQAYHVEASVVGHNIQMKAWKAGDPEPVKPMLSLKDKSLNPDSGSAICVITIFDPVPLSKAGVTAVRVSGTFDDITFTPGRPR